MRTVALVVIVSLPVLLILNWVTSATGQVQPYGIDPPENCGPLAGFAAVGCGFAAVGTHPCDGQCVSCACNGPVCGTSIVLAGLPGTWGTKTADESDCCLYARQAVCAQKVQCQFDPNKENCVSGPTDCVASGVVIEEYPRTEYNWSDDNCSPPPDKCEVPTF